MDVGGEAVLVVVDDDAVDGSPGDGRIGDDAVAGAGEGGYDGVVFHRAGEASLGVIGEFCGTYVDGGAGVGGLADEAGRGRRGRVVVLSAGREDKEGGKEKKAFHNKVCFWGNLAGIVRGIEGGFPGGGGYFSIGK